MNCGDYKNTEAREYGHVCHCMILIEFFWKLVMSLYFILQAKGVLSEYQPKYNSARAVYRERKKYVDEIDWNMLAVPPSGSSKVISGHTYMLHGSSSSRSSFLL